MYLIDLVVAKRKYIKKLKKNERERREQIFERFLKNSICHNCKFAYVDNNFYNTCKCDVTDESIEGEIIEVCEYFKRKKGQIL